MMAITKISVRGARQHNLKNISVEIPRNTLTVVTGLSGSGKSSLAFDTIYAEGQRRYVETLSAYARQFLDQMERPDVDGIDGLSPSISIEQKTTSRSPRSTVGTITEIYDYLRLLFASIGTPHCPRCGRAISRQSADQIVQRVMALTPEDRIMVMAPIVRGRKGEFKKEMETLAKHGYTRARIDGELLNLEDEINLDKRKNHTIEVVIDRLLVKPGIEHRLEMSVGLAMKLAGGLVLVAVVGGEEQLYSEKLACPDCGISVPQLEPRSFSFNSMYGACPECHGLGSKYDFDPANAGMPESGKQHYAKTSDQFVRGAYASKGGKSFICLSSTYEKRGERRSRIVFSLTPGNIVTTPRSDVMYVVTEFGMVNLKGKCVAERAMEIIALAHPDFREDLERQAYENRLIPRGVSFRCRVKKSEDLQKAQGFQ